MAAISSKSIGVEICEILCIDPKKTRTITISIPPNDVVMVTVDFYLQDTEVDRVVKLIRKYKIIEVTGKSK